MSCGQTCNEMVLEGSNGMFSRIVSVDVGWDKLVFNVFSSEEGLENC